MINTGWNCNETQFFKSYTLPKLIQGRTENGSSLFFPILLGFENFKCSFWSYPFFLSLFPEQPAPSNFLALFFFLNLSCPQPRAGLHVHSSVLGVGLCWARADFVRALTTAGVYLSNCSAVSGKRGFTVVIQNLWFLNSFSSFVLGRRGCERVVPCSWATQELSLSSPWPTVGFCVNPHQPQQKLLKWGLRDPWI